MSVHYGYKGNGGAKFMRPILTREEYLKLRNGGFQRENVARIRQGDEALKASLVQMNYSCLPNEDGSLKGSKRMSTTVGMDIDHLTKEEMAAVRQRIISKKDVLGLLMMEESARGGGYHLVFRRRADMDQVGNLKWASDLLEVAYDAQAKDITRVFFTTTEAELIYLDDALFDISAADDSGLTRTNDSGVQEKEVQEKEVRKSPLSSAAEKYPDTYHGIPFTDIIRKYWEVNNRGFEPTQGDRDTLTFQLASDLRHICGRNFEWLDQVIPCYDGFSPEEKRAKIKSALASEFNGFPLRLRNTLNALEGEESRVKSEEFASAHSDSLLDDDAQPDSSLFTLHSSLKRMPQGIRESIDAVGPQLAMPMVTAICPCIGALATGVTLDVHGQKRGLNLIAYIAGDFASGKGNIDPVVDAWMSELQALDDMYEQQEEEWRKKKKASVNKKEQPEEPMLPIRNLTLNNTVAKLAQQLANTEGKHAFSFTPEADTVAQKWKSSMCDFSVMLRQSYDGSKYDRRAKSVDAVNVHIKHLLWNVCMCGTPDALYRVVNNYTDGFQSRIALARTPDNTFAQLEDKPPVLTDRQRERIQQIAHLLPLMQGEVVLPKLEAKGREWVEQVRVESMKSDDKARARQRFRVCVTAQRIVCCILLCKVAEQLIAKHGYSGAEKELKTHPDVWKAMLLKLQTPQLLEAYDVIADYLLDCALYFFRDRIEMAFNSRDYAGSGDRNRQRLGVNDSIYARLDVDFGFEGALQHSISVKGSSVTRNQVQQMLKNWKKQGLIVQTERGRYRKVQSDVS